MFHFVLYCAICNTKSVLTMKIHTDPDLQLIKESSGNSFLTTLLESDNFYLSHFEGEIQECIKLELDAFRDNELIGFIRLKDQTRKAINQISLKFYRSCKKKLYSNLKIDENNNEIVKPLIYLDNLFQFIEACYQNPFDRLLFLRNNLGFLGEENFYVRDEIRTPRQTRVFIELRTEIVRNIVNCFTYLEQ